MTRLAVLALSALFLGGCANSLPERVGVALTDGLNNSWTNTERFLERSISRVALGPQAFDNRASTRLDEYCEKDGGIHIQTADPALAKGPLHFAPAPRAPVPGYKGPQLLGLVNGQWEVWQQQTSFQSENVLFRRTETRLSHARSARPVAYAVNYVAADRQGQFSGELQCADITLADLVKAGSSPR